MEAWVALGIVFGDALIAFLPDLVWSLVTEGQDSYVALRLKNKALVISAPTLLWNHFERGDALNLIHMVEDLSDIVRRASVDAKITE